jgi:hypothetical protein
MRFIFALAGLAALVAAKTHAPAVEGEAQTHNAGWWRRAKCYACKSKYSTKCRYKTGFSSSYSSAKRNYYRSYKARKYLRCYKKKVYKKCSSCHMANEEASTQENRYRLRYRYRRSCRYRWGRKYCSWKKRYYWSRRAAEAEAPAAENRRLRLRYRYKRSCRRNWRGRYKCTYRKKYYWSYRN